MNRLVIIGNGFDLAHGLPTSYRHFIDDFWNDLHSNHKQEKIRDLVYVNEFYTNFLDNQIKNFNNFKSNLAEYCNEYSYKYDEINMKAYTSTTQERKLIFEFQNDFFRMINIKNSQNWVDIENEYYNRLKKIVKSKCPDVTKSEEYWKDEQKKHVETLNIEFEQIKDLLEEYINGKINNIYRFEHFPGENVDWTEFLNVLKPISLFSNEQNILNEFIDEKDKNDIREKFEIEKKDYIKCKLYFLNFNYTSIIEKYSNNLDKDRTENYVNYIHGKIGNNTENKITFGFGDEMDDDYKSIENINDNEYLRNFKSFQYLQNSNYTNLLNFIESDKFQVVIVGHSCGLSDRTLLNTIFEHKFCRSIKVFYHKKENGTDNYTEITQNISRHFNKKTLMRERIVNKTHCQPLPQIQLPKKPNTTIF